MHKRLKPKIRNTGTYAAVMTGKGTGAIATIQVFGNRAEEILEKIFEPASGGHAKFERRKILLGNIKRGDQIIDEATIGCEGEDCFAINCHGNPLIAAEIMRLLKKSGARLIKSDAMMEKIYKSQGFSTIEIESKLSITRAKTLIGTKIISSQINSGLEKKVSAWLKNKKNLNLDKIRKEAEQILENTKKVRPIIYGAKIVLAGPANSGKSTLLNLLAGKQKAIVTDIAGTTLDYVSAECRMGRLWVEIMDTAGLGELRIGNSVAQNKKKTQKPIEKEAQRISVKIIGEADLVLLVLDNSKKGFEINQQLLKKIFSKPVITVLNKSDLTERLDLKILPKELKDVVKISAKTGDGIDKLIKKINDKFKAGKFNIRKAICVNARQEKLLGQLQQAESKKKAFDIISELLNGRD